MNNNLELLFDVDRLEFAKLKALEACRDSDTESIYLRAVYEFKNEFCTGELIIPHINISPILPTFNLPSIVGDPCDTRPCPERFLEIRNKKCLLPIWSTVRSFGETFQVKILEETPVKMTLKEIEDALGHKVEIIS